MIGPLVSTAINTSFEPVGLCRILCGIAAAHGSLSITYAHCGEWQASQDVDLLEIVVWRPCLRTRWSEVRILPGAPFS